MDEAQVGAAIRRIALGYALLADAVDGGKTSFAETQFTTAGSGSGVKDSVHAAIKDQEDVTAVREGKVKTRQPDPEPEPAPKMAKPAKTNGGVNISAKAAKLLAAIEDLAQATRPELKAVADELGLDSSGKKASELRDLLAPYKSGKVASTGTPAAPELTYPDSKTMRKEFRLFCKANRDAILEANPDFFDEEKDADDANERFHQIVEDEKLLKEAWKDNVWDLKQSGEWEKLVEEAAATV